MANPIQTLTPYMSLRVLPEVSSEHRAMSKLLTLPDVFPTKKSLCSSTSSLPEKAQMNRAQDLYKIVPGRKIV